MFGCRSDMADKCRKLYRWGFRLRKAEGGDVDMSVFVHKDFQRDALHLVSKMESITAAKIKRQQANLLPCRSSDPSSSRDSIRPGKEGSIIASITIGK